MDSIFECGVCFKAYNHQDKKPLSLPCGHSFCLECLKKMVKHGTITCPYDKVVHQQAPDVLPVNYQVLSGLPMLSQTIQQNAQASNGSNRDPNEEVQLTYCQTHTNKKIKFYCKND